MVRHFSGEIIVHADGAIKRGDVSLCGSDLIGDMTLGWDEGKLTKAKITCEHCITIIKHCKRIKSIEY